MRAGRHEAAIAAALGAVSLVLLAGGESLLVGTAARMGPGYFPRLIAIGLAGIVLAVLGRIVLALRAASSIQKESGEAVSWRAIVGVAGSVVAFALLIRPAGFLVACLVAVLACTAAQAYRGWGERLLLASTLTALSCFIFVSALGLPFSILPAFR